MGRPIFAVGILIPNTNFEYKTDGQGQLVGLPDGYRPSSQFTTDVGTSVVKTAWTGLHRGDSTYPTAPIYSSRGRAFSIYLQNTATVTTNRYIESPGSLPGATWGAEANDPSVTNNDFWYVRLRHWFRGTGIAPGFAANWNMQVIGYTDASEATPVNLCSIAIDGTADWNVGWVRKQSTSFKIISNIHHVRIRIVAGRGAASAGYAVGTFADFTLETLGPIDAASNKGVAESSNPSYIEEALQGTYYQLILSRLWEGYRKTPTRLGKGTRLPSGTYRWVDPSGGAMRHKFTLPLSNLDRKDFDKLYRLWLVNKGFSQDPGSYYGTPMPILFSPQDPDDMGFYYVAFDGNEFPLEPDGYFQPNTEAAQTYKGTLTLVEI